MMLLLHALLMKRKKQLELVLNVQVMLHALAMQLMNIAQLILLTLLQQLQHVMILMVLLPADIPAILGKLKIVKKTLLVMHANAAVNSHSQVPKILECALKIWPGTLMNSKKLTKEKTSSQENSPNWLSSLLLDFSCPSTPYDPYHSIHYLIPSNKKI